MTQEQALTILKTGAHVFLTGEAGSGKTHTINQYTEYLREHDIDFAVTASTGIAATHIHGLTIHSWAGIGIKGELESDDLKRIADNKYAAGRIKKAKVLIIDEISMLDGTILSLIERVCRSVRKGSLPFGGLQVVLVGDFFQLPPVPTRGVPIQFAFDSGAWASLAPTICYLTEQHRQEDSVYLGLLKAIRRNEFDESHQETIAERITAHHELPDDLTRLYSHNANVDLLNQSALKKLSGPAQAFVMAARGPEPMVAALKRGCLSPERLELKIGASVMFTKNNTGAGFVNGTLGTVMGFETPKQFPLVKTSAGATIRVEPLEWTVSEGDEVLAKITQLPLRLAWALTIHKSQGVSLDAAVMDLSQTFEYGQGYVALSRVRSLSGVHLIGINRRALEVHPAVLKQDAVFRTASLETERMVTSLVPAEIERRQKNFITVTGGKRRPADLIKRIKALMQFDPQPGETKGAVEKNAYRPWTPAEERELRRLHSKKLRAQDIAVSLGRKPGAIRSRIKKLNL